MESNFTSSVRETKYFTNEKLCEENYEDAFTGLEEGEIVLFYQLYLINSIISNSIF